LFSLECSLCRGSKFKNIISIHIILTERAFGTKHLLFSDCRKSYFPPMPEYLASINSTKSNCSGSPFLLRSTLLFSAYLKKFMNSSFKLVNSLVLYQRRMPNCLYQGRLMYDFTSPERILQILWKRKLKGGSGWWLLIMFLVYRLMISLDDILQIEFRLEIKTPSLGQINLLLH